MRRNFILHVVHACVDIYPRIYPKHGGGVPAADSWEAVRDGLYLSLFPTPSLQVGHPHPPGMYGVIMQLRLKAMLTGLIPAKH